VASTTSSRETMRKTIRNYWYYFLGNRLADWKYQLKLRHLEITHGFDVYTSDDYHWIDDNILYYRTLTWIRRASKYHLAIPENGDEYWTRTAHSIHGDPSGTEKVLTNAGVRNLLDQYREESKARHGQIKLWITMIASMVAAAGAIASYFAG